MFQGHCAHIVKQFSTAELSWCCGHPSLWWLKDELLDKTSQDGISKFITWSLFLAINMFSHVAISFLFDTNRKIGSRSPWNEPSTQIIKYVKQKWNDNVGKPIDFKEQGPSNEFWNPALWRLNQEVHPWATRWRDVHTIRRVRQSRIGWQWGHNTLKTCPVNLKG